MKFAQKKILKARDTLNIMDPDFRHVAVFVAGKKPTSGNFLEQKSKVKIKYGLFKLSERRGHDGFAT